MTTFLILLFYIPVSFFDTIRPNCSIHISIKALKHETSVQDLHDHGSSYN